MYSLLIFKNNTKNIYIISILFLISFNDMFAQTKNFKIIFRHCVQSDTNKVLLDTIGNEAVLIGNNFESNYCFLRDNKLAKTNEKLMTESEVFKKLLNDPTSLVTKNEDGKMEGTIFMKPNTTIDSVGNNLYFNKKKDSIFLREKIAEDYIITSEKAPIIKWEILEETKIIKNYKCYKAITHYRGRNYVAWFTTDIQIIAAPWKFNGLPGLVMDIYDSKNQVKIYVENIQYPTQEIVSNFYNVGKKISIQEYFSYKNNEVQKKLKAIQIMMDSQPGIENRNIKPKATTNNVLYGIEISSN